jgi:hypothetical protein
MMQRHALPEPEAPDARADADDGAGCFVAGGTVPYWIFLMSVGQTPQTATRTSKSRGPMRGTGTVSSRRSFGPRYTTARMVLGRFSTEEI